MRRFPRQFRLLLSMLLSVSLIPVPLQAQQERERQSQNRQDNDRRQLQTGRQTADPDGEDPDLPRFAQGRINKEEYHHRRDGINRIKRGLDDLRDRGDLRGQAIREMKRQQRAQRGFDLQREAVQTGVPREPAFNPQVDAISTTNWSPIGPAPIPNGQTSTVSTAVSGRVTAIAVHPTNPDIVYVAAAQGGVYRSLNGGSTWTQLMDNAATQAVGALAISPSSPTTLWVGTGEGNYSCDSYFGIGLYRIDNADTAGPTLVGPIKLDTAGNDVFTGRSVTRILVHPTDSNTIFVSTANGIGGIGCDVFTSQPNRGLFRSTNAGSADPRFTKLNVPTANINRAVGDMVFEPGNPNVMLVSVLGLNGANDGGIWRTTDALAASPTFTRTLTLGTTTAGVRAAFGITKISSTVTVYAATGESTGGVCGINGQSGRLRKSTDGGVTWGSPISGADGFCGGQCTYDMAVAVDPADTNIVYLGGQSRSGCAGVLKKTTSGSTFNHSDTGLHADTHVVVVAPSNANVVYTGNDGGVWRSNDKGANWTSLNNAGFSATQFQSIALHPTDPFFLIGGSQDNGTQWLQPTNLWTRADYGDGGFALIDQNATSTTNVTMYHTYYNAPGQLAGFARVTNTANAQDDGWSFFGCGGTANGISCSDTAVQFYAPMTLGPGNPNTLYFGTDRLYRSTNSGTNMSVVSQQFAANIATSAIGISPQNDNMRIVGLENGKVFATTTGSSTMTDVTGSIPAKYVARAVIDPNNSNTAYVTLAGFGLAAGQHIWKTTNLNAASPTWTVAGSGIPDVPVNGFVIDPANSNNLYAGTDIGVYGSTDGGTSWAPFGTGLPYVAVFDMAIQNANRILRVATHGRGIWEIALGVVPPPTPPADPGGLSASAVSQSQINLTWTDNSSNESGFKIERCQGAGCTGFAEIATVGAGVTNYSDTGLTASTSYSYRVRAYNAGGDSGYSNTAFATTQAAPTPPNAPSNLQVTSTTRNRVSLSWNDNSANETRFELERRTGTAAFAQVAQPATNATSYTDTGLSRRTTYTYRIRACNAGGCSAYSNEINGTTN